MLDPFWEYAIVLVLTAMTLVSAVGLFHVCLS